MENSGGNITSPRMASQSKKQNAVELQKQSVKKSNSRQPPSPSIEYSAAAVAELCFYSMGFLSEICFIWMLSDILFLFLPFLDKGQLSSLGTVDTFQTINRSSVLVTPIKLNTECVYSMCHGEVIQVSHRLHPLIVFLHLTALVCTEFLTIANQDNSSFS